MSPKRTTYLLVGVLLAVALLLASAVAVAGTPTTELEQTANETATDATVGNLTVWTAPTERFVDLSTAAGIREGMRSGWLTRGRTVAAGDTAVFALSAPDLTATVAASNATTPQAAFARTVTGSEQYRFRVTQTVESTLAETRPKTLNLSATRLGGALRVTPDVDDGTLYVALRTDRASFETEYRDTVSARVGDVYAVNVTAGSGTDTTSAVAEWEVIRRTLTFDSAVGGDVIARGGNLDCAPVAGETSIAPGTALRFTFRPDHDGHEAWMTTATVDSSGRFFACANTSRVPQNVSLSVTVDGVPDATGHIVGGPYEPTIVSAERDANGTGTVRAQWFRKGFVALYEVPEDAVGLTERDRSPNCTARSIVSTVANWTRVRTSALLDSGGSQTVRFDPPTATESGRLIAVVHPSRDRDGRLDFPGSDFPVCLGGTLEGDPVTPAAGTGSESDWNEMTSDPGDTATTPTADRSPTAPTTTADGPGLGPVAAVLALLAVALLARRRF